jgi:TatD DNase family protein
MNLTDTHCHLDFEKFEPDRPDVLTRAREAGLTRILIPGIDLPSSRRAVELAESDPLLFAAVGIHPTDALKVESQKSDLQLSTLDELRILAQSPRVVAIGEIGLDYYWDSAPHDVQKDVLKEQLQLAGELQLPVVVHLREKGDAEEGDCASDLLQILEEWAKKLQGDKNPLAERPGVLHSFSGSKATALKALQLNFFIGFTGPITYKNAENKREVARSLPLERILIETDAPFLAPIPQRGKRNEPAFVTHIAGKIAEIHNITPQEAAAITANNARRLFLWG